MHRALSFALSYRTEFGDATMVKNALAAFYQHTGGKQMIHVFGIVYVALLCFLYYYYYFVALLCLLAVNYAGKNMQVHTW